ncbi:MAG TPA: YicC/YloC family endoribonuclease [Pseudobacteroides sp.]|uniref:YicC/YloC family endoribonuclease n=1 Tax=Pseudobacteroides sp. TaxID=1968840 RepID=UPI002F931009
MIKSMTGFGRGEFQDDGKLILAEIKTVNHRYSDIFVKMPRQISCLEDKIRSEISKVVSRGKIDVFISLEDRNDDSKTVVIDEALAKAYLNAVVMLKDKHHLEDDISASLIAKFPDVLKIEKVEQDSEAIWNILKVSLSNALHELVKMRQIEGESLKNDLLGKLAFIDSVLSDIKLRAPEITKEYKQKLETRIKELTEQQTIDENRIATEVAIFADRCSIDEEIQRLTSHIMQMRETLDLGIPVGRKLDFLVQEMNREINTIGSKANDLSITKNVIDLKSELEKIREQIQNIE